jgi:phosphoesterase RecJ-like protein
MKIRMKFNRIEYKDISKKLVKILNNEGKFVILSHKKPDGDAIGSVLTMYCLLKKMNKNVEVACDNKVPYQFTFLAYSNILKKNIPHIDSNTVLISLDNSSKDLINLLYPDLKKEDYKLIINIDHHYKNTEFGDINLVNPIASSVTQIIYNIFKENDIEIDIKMAECLYTGLVTDSGRFQYINTTSQSHLMAAELISLGVDPIKIFRKVFENKPAKTLDLYKSMISRTKISKKGSFIYSYILQDDLKSLNLPYSASMNFIDMIRAIENVKFASFFKQENDGTYRVSLRSSSNVDVSKIAYEFGGGGHPMAAGYHCKSKNLVKCVKQLEDKFVAHN